MPQPLPGPLPLPLAPPRGLSLLFFNVTFPMGHHVIPLTKTLLAQVTNESSVPVLKWRTLSRCLRGSGPGTRQSDRPRSNLPAFPHNRLPVLRVPQPPFPLFPLFLGQLDPLLLLLSFFSFSSLSYLSGSAILWVFFRCSWISLFYQKLARQRRQVRPSCSSSIIWNKKK